MARHLPSDKDDWHIETGSPSGGPGFGYRIVDRSGLEVACARDKETADLILAGWRATTREAFEREAIHRAALKIYTAEILSCMDLEEWTGGVILPWQRMGAYVPKAADEETPEDIYNRILHDVESRWLRMVATRGGGDAAEGEESLDVVIHRAFLQLEPEASRQVLAGTVFVPRLKDRFSEELHTKILQAAVPKTAKAGCLMPAAIVLMGVGVLSLLAWQLA